MAVPTIEPSAVTAGDTVAWTRSLADYPASGGWTLSYALRSATAMIDITAGASGADHAVSVLPAVSRSWVPGSYAWAAFATKASDRYEVARGTMLVRANLAQASPVDGRTMAAKAVDDLTAALASFRSSGGRVRRYRIADREMEFETIGDLISLLDFWKRERARENAAASIAAGTGDPRRLYVRF
jgi:hypothetical protein